MPATRVDALVAGVSLPVLRDDLLEPVGGDMFELSLSNPPYVACDDARTARHSVRWDGGAHGCAVADRLRAAVPQRLIPGGVLLMVDSAMCRVGVRLSQLATAELRSEVLTRRPERFGPVLTARIDWLEECGLIGDGQRHEELVVSRVERSP
jgi:release factor glutamine methyltransferase